MKKLIPFIFALFAIGLTGCKELSKLTIIKLPYSVEIVIPDNLPILASPTPIETPEVQTNTETSLGNQGYNLNMVEKVSLEKFELVIKSPSDGDLNFFKSIKIYIAAEGLPETLVAEKDVPDSDGTRLTTITLNCKDVDLKDYFLKDKITFKTTVTTDAIVSPEYKLDAKSVFAVDLDVLGL
ncbi:conserved hypothetical protein [uncultured Paludibacter sp.]|nr:conserved hypothetical protein [uncultured Paludibacter sp.]